MSTPVQVASFILAGGQSKRMGCDKALLDWGGVTLLDHMRQLLLTTFDSVSVVGRGEIPDRISGLGPIGGIATALHYTSTTNNVIVGVDLPFLTIDFLKYFKETCIRSSRSLTVCETESGFAMCLGVRSDMRGAVDNYLLSGKRSLHGLIEQSDHETVKVTESTIFQNINSMDDYLQAISRSLGRRE